MASCVPTAPVCLPAPTATEYRTAQGAPTSNTVVSDQLKVELESISTLQTLCMCIVSVVFRLLPQMHFGLLKNGNI